MIEEIKTIFKDFKVNDVSIPVEHLKYVGSSETYITFTFLDEDPALSGNDETLYSVVPIDIDIYSKSNYLDILKEVKKLMKQNDWIWTGDSTEMYEEDTGFHHRTSSFEKEGMV